MKKAVICCLTLFIAVGFGADISRLEIREEKDKEPPKKPNIVKDYVCLRDGELCHPSYATNRGLYVSCSNGVAWEQQCPKCGYHPLTCPTRTLWFDGEKCEWASPKLASQPCIDRLPAFEIPHNGTVKDGSIEMQMVQLEPMQTVEAANSSAMPQNSNPAPGGTSLKEQFQVQSEKGKWPSVNVNSIAAAPPPNFFKSPKSAADSDLEEAPEPLEAEGADEDSKEAEKSEDEGNSVAYFPIFEAPEEVKPVPHKRLYSTLSRRKAAPDSEPQRPVAVEVEDVVDKIEESYFPPESNMVGSKIVKLSDPVFGLVDSPDGSGKQILVRVSQPFVFEDSARSILPILNVPVFKK